MNPASNMKTDPTIFLKHILESIASIDDYLIGITEEEFMSNREKQDAVTRRLEVIGEAVRHVPEDLREKFGEVEWHKIAAMRNLLIHEYFGVDMKLVWSVVKSRLPELRDTVSKILE